MASDSGAHRIGLMDFISEEQLDQSKKTRGERAEDGTAQRDKALFEILKENKDKKDAEFNERFKHRPPKALDEDETEFLDKYETSKREYERQLADEEAEQLRSFQEAVAAQSFVVRELKETPAIPIIREHKPAVKRMNQDAHPRKVIISVKPQAKKPKTDDSTASAESIDTQRRPNGHQHQQPLDEKTTKGLVSYSDESDEDND